MPPQRVKVTRDGAESPCLHDNVALRGRFHGSGNDRQPAGVRCQLAEQLVPGAAADQVDDLSLIHI